MNGTYRATATIHLGQYERYIEKDTVVMYDGSALDVGGDKIPMSPAKFKATVQARWFVPVEDSTTEYQPKPAGVTVGPAQHAGDVSRDNAMPVETVESDEKTVGSRQAFRDHREEMERTGGKRMPVVQAPEDEPQEAEVVAKLTNPAKKRTDVSSSEYLEELKKTSPVDGAELGIEYVKKADKTAYTGDVSKPTAGEDLQDLFTDSEAAVGYHPSQDKTEPSKPDSNAILEAKIEAIRAFLPDFHWDMSRHWKSRVADALKQDEKTLRAILSIETDTVKRHIRQGLAKRG